PGIGAPLLIGLPSVPPTPARVVIRLGSFGPPRPRPPPPKPPRPPRPPFGLSGSYCARTCTSSRRLAGGLKFTGTTVCLPISTILPRTLSPFSTTPFSDSSFVGPWLSRPRPPPPPPHC